MMGGSGVVGYEDQRIYSPRASAAAADIDQHCGKLRNPIEVARNYPFRSIAAPKKRQKAFSRQSGMTPQCQNRIYYPIRVMSHQSHHMLVHINLFLLPCMPVR